MLRNNVYGRFKPDPYGNGRTPMATPGTVLKKGRNRDARDKESELPNEDKYTTNNKINAKKTVEDAKESVKDLEQIKAPEFEKTDLDVGDASLKGMSSGVSNFKAVKSAGGKGAGTAAGIGAATAVVGVMGAQKTANKEEVTGGTMTGAASGAAMGATLGSIVPGIGTVVGAGVGAVVGGVAGYFSGKSAESKRKKAEKKEARERAAYNAKISEIKRKTLSKAKDLSRYQRIVNDSSKYDSKGNIRFKKGGLLPYGTINVKEAKEYLSSLEAPKAPIEKRKITAEIDKFKSGGKVIQKDSSKGHKESKGVPKFRRGGKLDLAKQNVIVGGPSHDDLNETGVKGDRGIPVVKNGVKVAEIESEELVLRKEAVDEIDSITKDIKKDPKAEEKLGELIKKELLNNTYDYSK
tara:strand:- start:246 stop:1469 length:1224 start_codon:yes stop_codon:yes gene_type:complete